MSIKTTYNHTKDFYMSDIYLYTEKNDKCQGIYHFVISVFLEGDNTFKVRFKDLYQCWIKLSSRTSYNFI